MKNHILSYSLLLICILGKAQNKIYICGSINSIKNNAPLESVHVSIQGGNAATVSKKNGSFCISVWKKINYTITFSHLSYKKKSQTIEIKEINNDTLFFSVLLEEKDYLLNEVTVSANYTPDTIFGNTKISIADFDFYEDKFIFLTYEKRLEKESEIMLVDENENIISRHFVPGEAQELYRDYLGNINVLCKKNIYKINISGNNIFLKELPVNDFIDLIKPCIDTLDENILFSDFNRIFPHFKYYAYDTENTFLKEITSIKDKDQDWQYHFEYYKLSNAEKAYALNMAQRIKGLDKYDVAAIMTGFANDFMYNPLYAPLFIINDTINIFNHYENHIFKYINDTVYVGKIPINYHQPKNWKEWKKKLLKDDENSSIYALYLKNGYYYLKYINLQTGEIESTKKLHFKHVEKIKIKGGYVYYTYRPQETLQKKFLYREKI
jgi:hypothetical protein